MSSPEAARQAKRRTLFLVAALFLAPLVIAFAFYYGGGWQPSETVNHGELVNPPRALPAVALSGPGGGEVPADFLRGKWSLVYIGSGECADACREALYNVRQVRLSLNREMHRVQRVFLYTGACCEQPWFSQEHEGVIAASIDSPAGSSLLAPFTAGADAPRAEGRTYIVDPHGNLVMSYAPGADPKGLREDLRRLLKLSHIG